MSESEPSPWAAARHAPSARVGTGALGAAEQNVVRPGNWQEIEAVMDSGAADSVMPEDTIPWMSVDPSPGQQQGMTYTSACGESIPNLGKRKLQVQTATGATTTALSKRGRKGM